MSSYTTTLVETHQELTNHEINEKLNVIDEFRNNSFKNQQIRSHQSADKYEFSSTQKNKIGYCPKLNFIAGADHKILTNQITQITNSPLSQSSKKEIISTYQCENLQNAATPVSANGGNKRKRKLNSTKKSRQRIKDTLDKDKDQDKNNNLINHQKNVTCDHKKVVNSSNNLDSNQEKFSDHQSKFSAEENQVDQDLIVKIKSDTLPKSKENRKFKQSNEIKIDRPIKPNMDICLGIKRQPCLTFKPNAQIQWSNDSNQKHQQPPELPIKTRKKYISKNIPKNNNKIKIDNYQQTKIQVNTDSMTNLSHVNSTVQNRSTNEQSARINTPILSVSSFSSIKSQKSDNCFVNIMNNSRGEEKITEPTKKTTENAANHQNDFDNLQDTLMQAISDKMKELSMANRELDEISEVSQEIDYFQHVNSLPEINKKVMKEINNNNENPLAQLEMDLEKLAVEIEAANSTKNVHQQQQQHTENKLLLKIDNPDLINNCSSSSNLSVNSSATTNSQIDSGIISNSPNMPKPMPVSLIYGSKDNNKVMDVVRPATNSSLDSLKSDDSTQNQTPENLTQTIVTTDQNTNTNINQSEKSDDLFDHYFQQELEKIRNHFQPLKSMMTCVDNRLDIVLSEFKILDSTHKKLIGNFDILECEANDIQKDIDRKEYLENRLAIMNERCQQMEKSEILVAYQRSKYELEPASENFEMNMNNTIGTQKTASKGSVKCLNSLDTISEENFNSKISTLPKQKQKQGLNSLNDIDSSYPTSNEKILQIQVSDPNSAYASSYCRSYSNFEETKTSKKSGSKFKKIGQKLNLVSKLTRKHKVIKGKKSTKLYVLNE